ncbi:MULTISPECIES: sugar-binding protein [Bacillus]|uniref:Glycoside hydrolase family 42 N-terminal domain-containing protein n=2 Tax=Bacillus TaxID=1386 RepID=A0A0M5JIQ0_9BACI|nr:MULTISPECIES: sugar-binding protein [Bacillus]ALC81507.1 hypothetical protein AM592_07780 [Bacillus gobiensis]MBP1080555.1 ribonucleotide monophosphatase NagD (HAD superfamily) [Bacillus capparidis]MED1094411.1 beta-galactosidase [Bacillus capparidis]
MVKRVGITCLIACLLLSGVFSTPFIDIGKAEEGAFIPFEELKDSFGNGKYAPVLANTGIEIDGQLDEWNDYMSVVLPSDPKKQVYINGWGGIDDLSAQVYFAHDDEALYIAASVKDNVHRTYPGSQMWNGDSLQMAFGYGEDKQFGPEYGFANANGEPDIWSWSNGSALVGKESVQMATEQTDNITIYEAKIPWNAIFAEKPTGPFPFSILFNDNDGAERRGWIEWTAGIGMAKDASHFAELDLIASDQKWDVWLDGTEELYAQETGQYTFFVPNYSDQPVELKISVPEANLEKTITVPAKQAYTETLNHAFPEIGTQSVTISAEEQATGETREDSQTVKVHPSKESMHSRLTSIESKLPELEHMLQEAKNQKIPIDYEQVDATVIKNFITYGRQDVDRDMPERAVYVIEDLEAKYNDAITRLRDYLDGSKKAKSVPRYVTGKPEIYQSSFIGNTVNSQTGLIQKRPIFFMGYGHFDQVRKDIPQFKNFGTNMIQIETGPNRVIFPPTYLDYWTISRNGNINADAGRDTSTAKSGQASLHFTNKTPKTPHVYIHANQRIKVKPNTTYEIKAWVKGREVQDVWFPGGKNWGTRHYFPRGTYDWMERTLQYKTGADETEFLFVILSENIIGDVWIDDVSMKEVGTDQNLLQNPGFETGGPAEGKEYAISKRTIENDIQNVLANAANHDVGVNLLLSPHYFPDFALKKWPELRSSNNGFYRFNFDHPKAKEIIGDYLRTLIPMIKDYPSLHSVTLTNEPTYQSSVDEHHLAKWHAYLAELYQGSIAELNRIYGTEYQSFEEVKMPTVLEATPHYYDWVEFNNTLFADWHKWMADLIKELAPELPVKTKIMGNKLHTQAELAQGIDPERFAAFNHINGNDNWNYIDEGEKGYLEELRFYDLQNSFRQAPVYNSEHHVIRDGNDDYTPEQAKHVRSVVWQGAIHGLSASALWVWDRTNDPTSVIYGSLLHRPDVVSAVGKTNLDLNRLSNEITAFQKDKAEVAILYSNPSLVYSTGYLPAVGSAYESLSYSGEKVRFISEKQIQEGKFDNIKLLIIPEATHVKKSTLNKLEVYSRDYGKKILILNQESLKFDEHNQSLPGDIRKKVFSRSKVIAETPTAPELRNVVIPMLSNMRLIKVMLMDAATNKPVYGVEWRSVVYNNRLLINIANYTDTAKDVYITINGIRISKWTDKINDVDSGGKTLKLQPKTPHLLSVPSF